jgi:hypothetical protein
MYVKRFVEKASPGSEVPQPNNPGAAERISLPH